MSETSPARAVVDKYYAAVDRWDLDEAFALFADDAVVRFGDQPDLVGSSAAEATVRTMVALAESVTHDIVRGYEAPGEDGRTTVVCEAVVTYRMLHSGNVIPHNAVTISEVADGKIVAQRNVGNLGPVLADHKAHAPA